MGENQYVLTTTNTVEVGACVHLIVDEKREKQTLSLTKKVPFDIELFAENNQKIRAEFNIFGQKYTVLGQNLLPALNRPLSENELKENFSKSEFFDLNLRVKKLDNVFILKKDLNEFRREVLQKIYELLTKNNNVFDKKSLPNIPEIIAFNDFIIVDDLDKEFLNKNVIYSPENYEVEDVKLFVEKCKKLNKNAYLDTPNFALKKDVENLKDIIEKTGVGVVANNYYALYLGKNTVVGAGLNVYYSFSASELKKPFFTAESDLAKRIDFAYMTLRHCPMKNLLNASCDKCPYEEGFTYQMDGGKFMKLKRKKLISCTFYLVD